MIDLFGLGQKDSPDPAESFETAPHDKLAQTAPPKGSHRLWALLLVLDSVFVIVFSGAVAAKIYHYLETPLSMAPFAQRRQAPKPAATAAAPDASTATVAVKAPEPIVVKPPESTQAPKPETSKTVSRPDTLHTAAGAATPRPPKPSMLTEPPRPRSTPTLAAAGGAASTPAPDAASVSAAKQKAAPVVFKVSAPNANKVFLVGAFIVHGGRKEMTREDDGVWSVKLYLNPGQYRYFFAVDKKKTLDPENPQADRGASLMTVQ